MKIAFLFYDNMTALDAIGPHEVLGRLPNAEVFRVAQKAGKIRTCLGLQLIADYAFSDVQQADVLCIPGAGNATTLREFPETLEWIRKIHQTTTWTTSVCTGSLILAAAGLLKGVNATTHWAVMDNLAKLGAIPKHERVVESGKIITAAGVSAGIDMALMLSAKIAGDTVAQTLQLGIEYDPEPPFDSGSPAKANPDIRENLRKRLLALFEPLP